MSQICIAFCVFTLNLMHTSAVHMDYDICTSVVNYLRSKVSFTVSYSIDVGLFEAEIVLFARDCYELLDAVF